MASDGLPSPNASFKPVLMAVMRPDDAERLVRNAQSSAPSAEEETRSIVTTRPVLTLVEHSKVEMCEGLLVFLIGMPVLLAMVPRANVKRLCVHVYWYLRL